METPAQQRRFMEELPRVLKGWRHLASDVRIDGELIAELLGESGGRLVFVHHIVGKKEEVVRGALKCVSRARDEARRIGAQFSVRDSVEPLVVVITEGKTVGVLRRLEALCPERLVLLADRRLSTSEGRARFLELLTPPIEAVAPTPDVEPIETAGSEQAPITDWDRVVARVDRIDSELERSGDVGAVQWRWNGELLCSIQREQGQIVGRIGAEGVPHDLSARRSLEIFIDWVLARHLELMELGAGESLRDVELMPHPSEPLLTPAEIAAFQE